MYNYLLAIAEREEKERLSQRLSYLKSIDVKAYHTDDGWVDRKNNKVNLFYPKFRESNIKVGDKIALGRDDSYRLVRVTKIDQYALYNNEFYFEPIYRNKKERNIIDEILLYIKIMIRNGKNRRKKTTTLS